MKRKVIGGLIAISLLVSGASASLLAGNGPGPNGGGYRGPPKSEAERQARQAACLEKNGGVCPNGGPKVNCPGRGMGQGNGKGKCARQGLRDGTGPRNVDGTCPNAPAQKQK